MLSRPDGEDTDEGRLRRPLKLGEAISAIRRAY